MKNQSQSNTRAFQFQFDLQIQKIKLLTTISIPKSSYLQIIWRRGQKNISTKIKPQIKGNEEEICFGETLSMISTCALNTDNNEFSLKDSIVSAVIYISGSQKLFGSVTINLSSVLNHNYLEKGVKFIEEELNGRAKSKIFMKLTSNYLKQMVKGDEQQSVGSGVHSSFNTSSYSIADRRLVDIPSKDTYSVLSYGGAIRYSARKEDGTTIRRQDSAKKLQEKASRQYGRFGGYGQNNYSKSIQQYNLSQGTPYSAGNLNTLASNTSNSPTYSNNTPQTQVTPQITTGSNIKSASVSSSTNRIIRSSDSEHNRSTMGENNRQLAQQQTRRSKLEAEVTKNKVENDELKNKLSEYVRQNMKIKQQLRKFYQGNESKQAQIKKQNEELKQRNYVLVSQVRELKTRFDKYINLERQCSSLRNERQGVLKQCKKWQQQYMSLKKQLQQNKILIQRSKETQYRLSQEVSELKMNKVMGEEHRKKQAQGKLKEMNSQIEYYQNSSKNLSMLLREAEEKARNFQRQAQASKKQNEQEYRKVNESLAAKEKQIKELNDKVYMKNQECSKYILEAQKAKSDYLKFRDQKINQAENNKLKLTSEVEKLSLGLKDANTRVDQLQQEKVSLNTQVRNEMLLRAKQTEKLKQLQENFSQTEKKWQKQFNDLRKAIQQLQMENLELNKILSEKTRSIQQTQSYKEQIEGLMKHNLQLELQIKYKNEQMQKLSKLQQEHQNLKCKSTIQQNNIKQLNDNLQKIQRECRQKNRSYILECEKSKMLMEERINISKSNASLKEELDRAKQIMFNGERQFQQMKICIQDLENRNITLTSELRKTQEKLLSQNAEKYVNDVKLLETRIRQLEMRDGQKIKSIQSLHRSLSNSSKQIKDLQLLSEQRYQQILNREQMIQAMQVKLQQLEEIRITMNKQIQSSTLEKKNIMKKNEVIMDELFSYKRRLQEERGRSHSTIQVRNSEDYLKIKNLQNELNKRDEKIRKLEKEMISLENENVNLSIQVMKKLQDITPK